jgi:hypothetical protein
VNANEATWGEGKSKSVCERETEKQRDRETEKQRDRETETQRDRETERQRDRETERQRDRETERQRDRETERQRDRETERQRGRETAKEKEVGKKQKDYKNNRRQRLTERRKLQKKRITNGWMDGWRWSINVQKRETDRQTTRQQSYRTL